MFRNSQALLSPLRCWTDPHQALRMVFQQSDPIEGAKYLVRHAKPKCLTSWEQRVKAG